MFAKEHGRSHVSHCTHCAIKCITGRTTAQTSTHPTRSYLSPSYVPASHNFLFHTIIHCGLTQYLSKIMHHSSRRYDHHGQNIPAHTKKKLWPCPLHMARIAKSVNHHTGMWPIGRALSLYPCSSLLDGTIYIVLVVLGAPAALPFYIARNYHQEEAQLVFDKRETWAPLSIVSTAVRKRKAVEPNALAFDCNTKEA